MMVVAFDTETALITPQVPAPPLACITWTLDDGIGPFPPRIIWAGDPGALVLVESWLEDDNVMLVGQNVAFDMGVLCAKWPQLVDQVFAKYDKCLVTDTKIRQQLLDIAAGCFRGRLGDDNKWIKYGYSLDDLHSRACGIRLKKDGWRLLYSYFIDYSLEQWEARAVEVQEMAKRGELAGVIPEKDIAAVVADTDPSGVVKYPLEDARATMAVYKWQEPHAAQWLQDQYRQTQYAWALHLSSTHGLRTTAKGVAQFEALTRNEYEEVKAELLQTGLVRPDGSRNMKLAMQAMVDACDRLGLPLRLTDGGKPSLDKDACDAVEDDIIQSYSSYQTLSKVLANDIIMLRSGCQFPIHPHYDLADTGRSTCTGPNIQALRRKKGIREAFVPRAGKVFAQADYEGLELHTLAQACTSLVGFSKLGEALMAGRDPHSEVAARILDRPYELVLKQVKDKTSPEYDARQAGKVCNFGFPVGLGPDSLVTYARKTYGVNITRDMAVFLKSVWLEQWPEMREYFTYVNSLMTEQTERGAVGMVEQLFVKRFRGASRYTGACSAFSQGLGGDCAKNAMYVVARAMYTDRSSPLFGARAVAFVHDEIIAEVPDDDKAPEAAQELGRLMLQGANVFLPDCPARIEPLLMDCWSKAAKPLYDANGRLRVWRMLENE